LKRGWPLLAILLAACSPTVSGEVRDATSDQPVASAVVEVTTSGWGIRDGGLVWDKDYSYRAATGEDGKFRVKGVDGGHRLAVRAPGYATLQTSLCSRSPMTVYVGGPYDGGNFGKLLSVGTNLAGARVGWRFGDQGAQVPEADAELIALRQGSMDNVMMPLRAPFGMAFRPGTGNPPREPPSGYQTDRTLDLLECGWLFVRTRDAGTVPVRIGSFGLDEPIGGGRYLTLTYAEPPATR
jgi:hypothetical protein